MCGINGFNWQDKELMRVMNKSIKHRGPDDEDVYTEDGLSLGHVRLSILDLSSRGKQPMANHDQSIYITYNGEIYNFPEIKKDLESKGYPFQTGTDTEVIIYAYQEYNEQCFQMFNGIFSFCLYDKGRDCLYLVRDRLGIKPLYYFQDEERFVFSSEVKAFYSIKDLELPFHEKAEDEYFLTNNIYQEGFLKNISVLEPGSFLRYDLMSKKSFFVKYCSLDKLVSQDQYTANKTKTEEELVDALDGLLNKVVRDQLVSDAPLGTICSGGIDSSLITAIACRYKKDLKIFNVKVENEEFDESAYAKRVAEYLKLPLYEEVLNKQKYIKTYKTAIGYEDLPLVHPNSVGIYLVSKKARSEGLSVLLSGEGADELFGGYHRYKAYLKRLYAHKIPIVKSLLQKKDGDFPEEVLSFYLLSEEDKVFQQYKDASFVRKRFEAEKAFYQAFQFINDDIERKLKAFIAKDLKYYLVSILRRTDRMSMGNSLEMRVPFLDNRLLEFALNLPVRYMVSADNTKYLLKKVAERYLPHDIVYRMKKGFPVPVNEWLGAKNFKEVMYADWKEIHQSLRDNYVLSNL